MKNAIGVALLLLAAATAFAGDPPELRVLSLSQGLREAGRGPLLLRPEGVPPSPPADAPETVQRFHPAPREYDRGQGRILFICPKDRTELRMETVAPGAKFKCPVDGTEMRRGRGRDGRVFLIDEDC